MRKFLSILMVAMLFCLSFACAETADGQIPVKPWYELSEGNAVLTVRLPGSKADAMDWVFEISNPDALEPLAHEVFESDGGDASLTYVTSFFSMACAENEVSLILRYIADDPNAAPVATRVLQLNVSADNAITVVSVLEGNQIADWAEYDAENCILTVRLDAPQNGSQTWDMAILNPELLDTLACEIDNGFVGTFIATRQGAGATQLSISNDEGSYTVDLTIGEDGSMSVTWAESLTFPAAE